MVLFQDRPECKAAVVALLGPGVSKGAILECLRKLLDERGGDEAWTFIKAQDYQCVRELLIPKRAEKSRLMNRDGDTTNDLSDQQLTEANVLCELLEVPVWYIHRTVKEIYQNYGAQPSAWESMKEGDWEQVMNYIQNDPKRPSSDAAPNDHGASTSGQAQPEEPLQRLPRFSGGLEEWSEDAGRAGDADNSEKGEHDKEAGITSTMSEVQRALVEEIERKAVVLAYREQGPPFPDRSPGSPSRGATKRVISPPPQPQASASGYTSKGSLEEPLRRPARVAAPDYKIRQRTQLLELSKAPPNRAALVKKSQEASEEAQRKRREEREHQARLASGAGSFHKRGQETVQKGVESAVPAHRGILQADCVIQRIGDAHTFVNLSPVIGVNVEARSIAKDDRGPGDSRLQEEGRSSTAARGQAEGDSQRVGRSNDDRTPAKESGASAKEEVRQMMDGRSSATGFRMGEPTPRLHTEAQDLLQGAQQRGAADGDLLREGLKLKRGKGTLKEQEPANKAGTSSHVAESAETLQIGTGKACLETVVQGLKLLRKAKGKEHEASVKEEAGKRSDGGSDLDAETISCGPWSGNQKHRGLRSMAALVETDEVPTGGKEAAAGLGDRFEDVAKENKGSTAGEKRKKSRLEEAANPPPAKRRANTPEQRVDVNDKSARVERERSGSADNGRAQGVRLVSEDVANGWEAVRIPCVNAFTKEDLPDSFRFIKQNQAYDQARQYAPAPLVRQCFECECGGPRRRNALKEGSCRALSCSCTEGTGGVYAYDGEGRLSKTFLSQELRRRENGEKVKCEKGRCPTQKAKLGREERMNPDNVPDCEGHFLMTFIRECGVRCRCSRNCINRVVQRGINARLQVYQTPDGKGWGLQCLDWLLAGSFVCVYVGQIMTGNELFEINKQRKRRGEKHTYPLNLDADYVVEGIVDDETGLCLDATDMGNVARFINHRCGDATLLDVPVEIDSADHNYYHLCFFTNRDVPPLEELTWDYGIDFADEKHPIKAFPCKCGSLLCRDRG